MAIQEPHKDTAHESADSVPRFSEEILRIIAGFDKSHVTLWELQSALHERGIAAFMVLLCLPFLFPMPLPGLSTAFGFAIIVLSLSLCFGVDPFFPQFIGKRTIEVTTLLKIATKITKVFARIERFFKPRFTFLAEGIFLRLAGITIIISALLLALPIPPIILFSNSLPAIAILCISVGILEKDGIVIAFGHLTMIATCIYFTFLWHVISAGIRKILEYYQITLPFF